MTNKHNDVYILSALRSPVGKAPRGVFRQTRPDTLLAHVIKSVMASVPQIEPALIEDVIVGCAMPEAEQGMNVARIALLLAGLPDIVPGMTVNRFCASGVTSIAIGAQRIALGDADLILAGGTESMSMIPMGGHKLTFSPAVFSNKEHFAIAYGMGITAERVAKRYKITRQAQDAFSLTSHQRALSAIENGCFSKEITPFEVCHSQPDGKCDDIVTHKQTIAVDQGPRGDTTLEALSKLKPVFAKDGTVTAGNTSQMSDGAGMVLLASERIVKQHSLSPIGLFREFAITGVEPEYMGIGPIAAIPKCLKKAGLHLNDIDWIELNEAFAAQSLAVINHLEMDPDKVNPYGGAIALGHPLGATGAIRAATLLHGLAQQALKYGMVTMCVGTGMGAAALFERI